MGRASMTGNVIHEHGSCRQARGRRAFHALRRARRVSCVSIKDVLSGRAVPSSACARSFSARRAKTNPTAKMGDERKMRTYRTLSVMALLITSACSSSNDGASGPAGPSGEQGPAGPGAAAPSPAPSAIDVAASLSVPGAGFYPQSVYAAADGTLFVGGIGGEVVKFAPSSLQPVKIADNLGVIPGLTVDDKTQSVFVCGNVFNPPPPPEGQRANPFQNPTGTLYQYAFDGTLVKKYAVPNPGSSICEDLVFDTSHNLFLTDAFTGAVFKLADGASEIVPWTSDPMLVGNSPSVTAKIPGFGAHGVTYDGTGSLYVTNFHDSTLIRIPIGAGGAPGAAIKQTVTAAPEAAGSVYAQPEGVHALDATHLVGTSGTWGQPGYLLALTQSAPETWTWTVLRNNLAGPTSVAVSKGNYFVVEGQASALVNYLLSWSDTPPNPSLPFLIQRQTAE
jgi:hypothetical protein